jgi:hypothetical protein
LAAVAEQGAQGAPKPAASTKAASQKKKAPKGQKAATKAKHSGIGHTLLFGIDVQAALC